MELLFNFGKGFPALAEALTAAGCRLTFNSWHVSDSSSPGYAGCIADFAEIVRQPWRAHKLQQKLAQTGGQLIAVDRDAPWHKGLRRRRLWWCSLLKPADIYATHSMQSAGRFASQDVYLPNAAWLSQYNLGAVTLDQLRDPACYRYDVSFLGNLDAARFKEHRRRVAFLHQLEDELRRRNISYLFRDTATVPTSEQVDIIQHSRINLNYGAAADHGKQLSWGLPERCYGIPACGGFLLSDARKHATTDFAMGTEWVEFTDITDCVNKIEYFRSNLAAARNIAEAAHAKILATHTYAHRAQQLIELLTARSAARA